MRRVVVVTLLSGCSSILGIEDFKVGDGGTGSEMMEQGYCLGPMGWRVCLEAMPTMPRMIDSSLMFDTQSSPLCAGVQPMSWTSTGQPPACFIVGTNVMFGAPMIQAIGGRPLVVFASDTISITTQLDVASHVSPVSRGPSSPSSSCVAPTVATNGAGNQGAGGGAGGSFMTKGGDGGNSSSTAQGGRAAAADTTGPMLLRAGCGGGIGGMSNEAGGAAGAGGGAVYLVAGNRITINGFINASGSAGQGGSRLAGGGGGGSGGMIHLHAPSITGTGVLVANGGGGGEGGDTNLPGVAGNDPVPNMPMITPLGGNNNSVGGAGGNGFASMQATVGGTPPVGGPSAAGGGGGGGAGYIRVNTMPSLATSPMYTLITTP